MHLPDDLKVLSVQSWCTVQKAIHLSPFAVCCVRGPFDVLSVPATVVLGCRNSELHQVFNARAVLECAFSRVSSEVASFLFFFFSRLL